MSIASAGVLLTIFGAATIPSRLLGGQMADRIGRKATIIIGLFGCALAQLLVAVTHSLVVVVLALLILGLVFELYEPPSRALIADVTPPEYQSTAYALLGTAFAGAGIAAGLIAAWVGQLDVRWLFFIDAATCLICAIIVAITIPSSARKRGDVEDVKDFSLFRDSSLLAVTAVGTIFSIIYFSIIYGLPITVVQRGLPVGDIGLLLTLGAIVIVVCQPILVAMKIEKINDFTAMALGYVLLGAGLFGYAFADTFLDFAIAKVVESVGDMILLGRAYAVVAALAPEHKRGRYMAVYGTSWGVAAIVAPWINTQLLEHSGGFVLWSACTIGCLVVACMQPMLRRLIARRNESGQTVLPATSSSGSTPTRRK